MTVAVVTDSAASLPPWLADQAGIAVVPMLVTMGGESRSSNDFEPAEILAYLEEGVETSGPSPGDFVTAIEGAPGGPDDPVVVLTIASTMSSTCEAAQVAARLVERPAIVVDTRTAAGAEGLVALAAARAAAEGSPLGRVEQVAREVISRVRLTASVAGLDQLVRSGRVPQVAGWAGRHLGLRPLFEFRNGNPRPLRPAISKDAALERIIDIWRRSAQRDGQLHVAAMHAFDPDGAERLLRAVETEVKPSTSFVGEFGPVMVAHTGPGLVGLAWYWEDGAQGSGAAARS